MGRNSPFRPDAGCDTHLRRRHRDWFVPQDLQHARARHARLDLPVVARQQAIQTVLMPNGGKSTLARPPVATEPLVRVAQNGKDPSRTYRYLLESPYEMQLLEHLLTGQLAARRRR